MEKTEKTEHIEVDRLYRGLRYIVRLRDRGFRCGYIQIPQEDQEDWEEISNNKGADFVCHGGITYCDVSDGGPDDFLPPGRWIGFDCMHHNDGCDYEAVKKLIGNPAAEHWRISGDLHNWTSEEVEEQCRDLIDQYKSGIHL